jgi:hypothetical protein
MVVELSESLLNNSHVLITSRDEVSMRKRLAVSKFKRIEMDSGEVNQDIASFIQQELEQDTKHRFGFLTASLKEEVVSRLSADACGMYVSRWNLYVLVGCLLILGRFRLAQCQLDNLCGCRTAREVRKALRSLPKTLNETYKRMLGQIDDRDRSWAKQILTWLVAALRPLSFKALTQALSIDLTSCEIDEENYLLDPESIFDICRSLVILQEDGYISLAHLSVKQFLESSDAEEFFMQGPEAHYDAARACFTYLTSPNLAFRLLSTKGLERQMRERALINDCDFLKYCSLAAFEHIQQDNTIELRIAPHFLSCFLKPENVLYLYENSSFLERTLRRDHGFHMPTIPFALGKYGSGKRREQLGLRFDSTILSRAIMFRLPTLSKALVRGDVDCFVKDASGWTSSTFAAATSDVVL